MADLYQPTLNHPPSPNLTTGTVQPYAGNPNGVLTGTQGNLVLDTVGNAIYSSNGGTSWTIIAGGSSGAQLVTYSSGNPPNPPNISQNAMAYDPAGILPTKGWDTVAHVWN